MPRYVAFLRGVMPTNAKMPELKRCFEAAGFADVRTVLASGNVVFDARSAPEASLERKAEAAMRGQLGRSAFTIVRRAITLGQLLESDPYAAFSIPPNAKRIVSFLREPRPPKLALPIRSDGAQILALIGRELFSTYEPCEKGPVFMALIEKAFGSDITTRTWETVRKCAEA